jgi:HAD superfamily hydrolase (TIGR01509 family)
MLPAAVLCDMDGTLVDTERLWWDAVAELAELIGRPLTAADAGNVLGRPVAHTAEFLAGGSDADGLGIRLHEAFVARVSREVVPLPGAVELLHSLVAVGIPVAIVSASPRDVVDLVRAALGPELFTVTIAVEDTGHTKPAPDPYFAATAALGVSARDCVAIEDTAIGAAAAHAAGCFVVAVPALDRIPAGPRTVVVDSLEDVSPDWLASVVMAVD